MNCHHALALAAAMLIPLAAPAQQTETASNTVSNSQHAQLSTHETVPSAAVQLKVLTQQLSLTSDQRAQIKPILDQLHLDTVKVAGDENLTHEQRVEQVAPLRMKARDQIYAIITDEQKRAFEAFMQTGPHPEMHGSLGMPAPAQQ